MVPNWVWLGLGSAVFAALVGVVGKRGLDAVDPTLGTAIRAVIMAAGLVAAALLLGKAPQIKSVPTGALGWIAASGAAGAASWLCYFWALRLGPAGPVAALDRTSVAFALILAALLLGEKLTPMKLAGGALIVAGAILVVRSK
jgi:transporter family protein